MVTLQVKLPIRRAVDKALLLRAAQQTLEIAGASLQSDLSIVVGDDTLVRKLNHQYRGLDSVTDVLSFSDGEIDPDTSNIYLGDVVISYSRAQEQALSGGHPLADELQLLVVHGVLHLLGYDHSTLNEKKEMQAVQDKVLAVLGSGLKIRL